MKELLRLKEKDSLNEYQAQWFRSTKYPEELYDTWNDPDELKNLVKDSQHQEKLIELRAALDQWIAETQDKGMIPEREYVELIGTYNEEPVTKTPIIVKQGGLWVINSKTKGSSIGSLWLEQQGEPLKKSWNIYTKPLKIQPGKILVAKAHRIGFKPSPVKVISN